jgi:hypothetical protein
MSSVGSTEGIVDVHITEFCQLLGEIGIVFSFCFVIAYVLQKKNFTGTESLDLGGNVITNDIRSDRNLGSQNLSQPDSHGR